MSAFDKVIGYEKEKEELYQLCDMAKNPEKYAASGFALFHHDNHDGISSCNQEDGITAERSAMLARCYEEAKDVLRRNWAFVEKLAASLVERDTLVFEEIAELRREMAA